MANSITILGLGPGTWGQVTIEAQEVLASALEVWLRTARHPVVASLPGGPRGQSFDYLYDEKESFDEVYAAIVARLLDLARRPGGVVYAVPGHPLVGERSVALLLPAAREAGLAVRIVAGLSFLEPVFTSLELDPLAAGLQIVDATDLAVLAEENLGQPAVRPGFLPTSPLLVPQVYNQRMASAVKLHLLNFYASDHEVELVQAAGVPGEEKRRRMPLYTLDRDPGIEHMATLYVPPLAPVDDLAEFSGLRYVVARLRAPGGCPWDREQTHESLKPYVIEEAYEVLEALDASDAGKLSEELGDLLLQVVLHAQLGEEAGEFSIEDVLRVITAKLIRRHPHVFGDVHVRDSSDVLRNWQQIKREEKQAQGVPQASLLGDIPRQLPALAYALSLQKRAARVGFDWTSVIGVEDKVAEEIQELKTAEGQPERFHELGDVLFSVVNLARWLKVDAEEALRQANLRFKRRFLLMERLCAERGRELQRLSAAEMDDLWEEAKRGEAEQTA
ncbi:MAG: bifunctional methyltransferase/pyrophosphohydrolase YabN [Chloroflexota bacterium]